MNVSDTVDYDIHRVEDSVLKDSSDCIAIEEPLEIAVRYFKNDEWIVEPLMVTMRTPGDDESLVSGLLFSEGIIQDKAAIDKIVPNGENEGKYDIDNSLIVTLTKGNQLDLKNLQRHFMVNSSCGVCGKGTLNAIEIAYEPEIDKKGPIVSVDLITRLPDILSERQEQFANTGGVHASALLSEGGEILHLAEDVGRHNALDKLIGHIRCNGMFCPLEQFVMCSGRRCYPSMAEPAVADALVCPTRNPCGKVIRFDDRWHNAWHKTRSGRYLCPECVQSSAHP